MKNIIASILIILAAASSMQGQTIQVYRSSLSTKTPSEFTENKCYDPKILTAISDSMFREGNYKYLLVDLFRDGYITEDGNWYNIYPSHNGDEKGGISIPDSTRSAYGAKWDSFARYIKQPHPKYGYYIRPHFSIEYKDIINPKSELRAYSKNDLFHLHLAATGELRLYTELVKDSLNAPDKPINFQFNKKGFYVQGKKLDDQQRAKYSQICKEEFGDDFYTTESSWARGALADRPLKKELEELTARINGTYVAK